VRSATLSAIVYVLLAALAGIDVLRNVNSRIASDPGDPLLTAAVLTWNAEHVPLTEGWWQFPIFHPATDVLAFSEHLLGLSVIAAPLYWLSGNPLLSYNLTLLLTYPLCGLAMYALAYRLTLSRTAAFLAGLAFALAPVRAAHLPHVQLLATFYTPLVLLGLHAFVATQRRQWLVLLGVAWLLQGLASGYLLVSGSVLTAGWLVWFVVAPRRWRELRAITVTLALASVPLVPILVHYAMVHSREGFSRGFPEAALFAADLASLLCAPAGLAVWGWLQVGCTSDSAIFPGLALVLLCAIGGAWQWRAARMRLTPPAWPVATGERRAVTSIRRIFLAVSVIFAGAAVVTAIGGGWRIDLGPLRATSASPVKPASIALGLLAGASLMLPRLRAAAERRSLPVFYLLAALAAWILSWGPSPGFLGTPVLSGAPFAWLTHFPGGDSLRVPARFWLTSALCLAALMGILVAEVLKRRSRPVAFAIVVAAAIGLIADGWAWIPVARPPEDALRPDLLRSEVVLELPAGETRGDIAAVYRAVTGGWRTVNGFSGYEPREYERLREASRAGTIDFEPLLSHGTLHVLVAESAAHLQQLVAGQPGSELIGQAGGLLQYRIRSQASDP
jgi:hypothetical protein